MFPGILCSFASIIHLLPVACSSQIRRTGFLVIVKDGDSALVRVVRVESGGRGGRGRGRCSRGDEEEAET